MPLPCFTERNKKLNKNRIEDIIDNIIAVFSSCFKVRKAHSKKTELWDFSQSVPFQGKRSCCSHLFHKGEFRLTQTNDHFTFNSPCALKSFGIVI